MKTEINFISLFDKIDKHFRHPVPSVMYDKNIVIVGQLIAVSDKELLAIRNFGKKNLARVNSFREILRKVEQCSRTIVIF